MEKGGRGDGGGRVLKMVYKIIFCMIIDQFPSSMHETSKLKNSGN